MANENRVRFSAEFSSSGAEKLKRDLEDIRQGRKDLNDVIGSGRQVSQDAAQGMDVSSQATQNALKSVEDSTRALQAAFTALPQGVQQSLAQVMDRIRASDFVGAMTEKARVRGVPQTFTDQLNGIAQATLQATTVLPDAAVSATIRQALPQRQFGSRGWTTSMSRCRVLPLRRRSRLNTMPRQSRTWCALLRTIVGFLESGLVHSSG